MVELGRSECGPCPNDCVLQKHIPGTQREELVLRTYGADNGRVIHRNISQVCQGDRGEQHQEHEDPGQVPKYHEAGGVQNRRSPEDLHHQTRGAIDYGSEEATRTLCRLQPLVHSGSA